jgi:hypothetical protein
MFSPKLRTEGKATVVSGISSVGGSSETRGLGLK